MEQKNQTLKHDLSPINIWALALGCIIGWGAFVMPGDTFLCSAGTVGTMIAIGIASGIMIIIAFNYQFMIEHTPTAGGEFAYATLAFGKKHGFICAWFLALSYLSIVPLNATALALLGRNLLGDFFQFGFHYRMAGYEIYAGEILLAIVALAIFAALSIRGVKGSGFFQTVLTVTLVVGVLILTVAAVLSPSATLSNLRPTFASSENKLSGVLAVLAVAPWAFVGFDTVPQAVEEINFSAKKTRFVMIVAILFGGMVYITLNTITASIVPSGYTNYVEYVQNINCLDGLISLPTFYAAHQLLGTVGLLVIGVSVIAAILSGINGFYIATSRLLYSLAREQIIPNWFRKLNQKSNTPQNAILFIMILSMVAPFFGRTALGWIVDMASIGAAIGYGYTSAAALKVAVYERRKTMVFTGILGCCFSVIFCVLLLVPIDTFSCSLGRESYICLIVWVILGGVFLYSQKRKTDK